MRRRPTTTPCSAGPARVLACLGVTLALAVPGRAGNPANCPLHDAINVVDAVNALAGADIAIDAAESTSCDLDRLPGDTSEVLALVPPGHRLLIQECVRGRPRLRRRQSDFDLPALLDASADRPDCVATLQAFFAARTVDVATGEGVSDGPYPIRFDWAVVLDPRSGTLFSFVLNCRD